MDGFAVDLDKVLDEFELSEGDGPAVSATDPKPGALQPHLPPSGDPYKNTSPQVTPVTQSYAPTSISIPSLSRPTGFPNRYDIPYQPPQKIDLAEADFAPSTTHTVHHGNVSLPSNGAEDILKADLAPRNGHTIGCSSEDAKAALPIHSPNGNYPWERLDNGMAEYDVKGGVLAHGELSKDSLCRRLSDDRPELIQSMAEDLTSRTPFTGEVRNLQPFMTVSVVNSVHPDVIPTSVNSMMDVARPLCHEGQNDSGVSFTSSEHSDPPSLVSVLPSEEMVTTPHTLPASSPQHHLGGDQDSRQSSISPEPLPEPEAVNVDSPTDSTCTTEGPTQDFPPSEHPAKTQLERQKVMSGTPEHTLKQGPSDVPTQTQCDTAVTCEKSETVVEGTIPPPPISNEFSPRPVGFENIDDVDEDEMDAYLAELEQQTSSINQLESSQVAPTEGAPGQVQLESNKTQSEVVEAKTEQVDTSTVAPEGESTGVSTPVSVMERRESGGSVEKFLAPDLTSPGIVTPMDDPGFTKVPGFVQPCTMPTLQEDDSPVLKEAVGGRESEGEEKPPSDDQALSQSSELPEGVSEARTTGSCEAAAESNAAPSIETSVSTSLQAEPIEATLADKVVIGDETTRTASCPEDTLSEEVSQSQPAKPPPPPDALLPQVVEQLPRDLTMSAAIEAPQVAPGAITVCFPIRDVPQSQPMDTTTALEEPSQTRPPSGVGARPKELPQVKKSRPNSLLGLSKPDLKPAVPIMSSTNGDSGYVESMDSVMGAAMVGVSSLDTSPNMTPSSGKTMVENTHDVINRQLAQKMKSPQQKEQLNLEIKQHFDGVQRLDGVEQHSAESHDRDQSSIPVVTNRAQLASGIGLNLPTDPTDLRDSGFQDDTMPSSLPQSVETQSPSRSSELKHSFNPFPPQHPNLSAPSSGSQEEVSQPAAVAAGAQAEQTQSTQPPKLKRPTSLNLIPHSDFQASQDKESQDDDSTTGEDVGYGSSGHLTPFSSEGELSEPPGAMASGPDMMYSPPEVGPGAFSPPMGSSNINVVITQLGKVAPRWVPDSEACNCMQCEARFTFTKRRHHCRACGKVFCSACCNLKCKLQYMDSKEARVCSKCYQDIVRAQAYERMHSPSRSPNPNNPAEYCSTVPPLQQASATLNAPPPSVMVPVGVLRKEENTSQQDEGEGSQRNREPKQVMFSDGIRPGGDLTELDGSEQRIPQRRHGRTVKKVERQSPAPDGASDPTTKSPSPKSRTKRLSDTSSRNPCLIPDNGLPPVILSTGIKGDFSVEEDPDLELVMPKIRSIEDPNPVAFAINKNLFVLVKIVNLDCCVNRVCWCFSTKGMCTVGQDEVVIVLECLPDEKTIPRDIFCHINSVYDEASKGNTVSHLGHTIFGQRFLESWDHCGFLYVRPTFQCVQKLLLPSPPYVFGLLLQKWETPWAKVFPIRLMLRLGAEYRYYPCPLISVRFRKPVFGEIGHTIMNLLADFRNYQYMLPQIRGVVIHMEEKKTYIRFPRNRYDEVMKVINNSNDHVMALGANFSVDADSHLVCIQNEDGNYQTQAINIQNKPRKVTGASFVVFNGALKTSSGLRAKSSIVEDGLMVQITAESMSALKMALREMRDYNIGCGTLDTISPEEQVLLQWTEDDNKINQGVKSPIDNLPMDGIESLHIHNSTDYVGETRTIRWTEVFFIKNEDAGNSRCEPVDLSRLAETLAQACCIALTPQLDRLKEASLTRIGLRCTIDRDRVGYEIGANGDRLPDFYMNELDSELIPVIHNAGSNNQEGPVVLELIFHVIE